MRRLRTLEGQRLGKVVAAAVVFLVGVYVVIKWAPGLLAADVDPRDRAEEIGRARTALLAALAGGIALFGAYYTSRTFELNRQGQITERFTRAIDQLGHTEVDVKLGGIYALERIARESRDDHGPIVEILTAYVREHAARPALDADPRDDRVAVTTDVQAALSVLGRRRSEHDTGQPLDLRATDLTNARMANMRLEGASLADARLHGADLSYAQLQKATLIGADLRLASGLDLAELRGTFYDPATVWPEDFDPVAAGAVPLKVPRRLVICCDGVWGGRDELGLATSAPTNVTKLAEGVAGQDAAGQVQLTFYDDAGRRWDRSLLACYRFLVETYVPGDQIFLFGGSRGASVARSLTGLIANVGIVRREFAERVDEGYRLYRSRTSAARPDGIQARQFRADYAHEPMAIEFLGVFDTVGPLGVPKRRRPWRRRPGFRDILLSGRVRAAYQALAIDERRAAFAPAVWSRHPYASGDQRLEQVWFAGVHGDVVGGYRDSALADVPLRWMAARAMDSGLAFKPDYFASVSAPNALGPMHESYRGRHRLRNARWRDLNVAGGGVSASAVRRLGEGSFYHPPNLVAYLNADPAAPVID